MESGMSQHGGAEEASHMEQRGSEGRDTAETKRNESRNR